MRTYRGKQSEGESYGFVSHGAAPYALAKLTRQSLTPLEQRFDKEKRQLWKGLHWHRYAPVTLQVHPLHKSTWFAPFLCVEKKLIVVIQDREDFPYRIYGQIHKLYAQHGYTVLDFSEDFSCPVDESVWQEMMGTVGKAIQ